MTPSQRADLAASSNLAYDTFKDSDMQKLELDVQCRDAGIRFTCL